MNFILFVPVLWCMYIQDVILAARSPVEHVDNRNLLSDLKIVFKDGLLFDFNRFDLENCEFEVILEEYLLLNIILLYTSKFLKVLGC